MRTKKDWKYYLRFYLMIVVVYAIYVIILAAREGAFDTYALWTVLYLPPLFVGFVVIFDRGLDPIFRRLRGGKRQIQDDYQGFVNAMTEAIDKQHHFSIEGYRRLRENDRFQKALQQAYRIQTTGETTDLNFVLLSKKFKKDTEEFLALQVVIEEVQKTLENQGKDYQK